MISDGEIEQIKNMGAANLLKQRAFEYMNLAISTLRESIQCEGSFERKVNEAEGYISNAKKCYGAHKPLT